MKIGCLSVCLMSIGAALCIAAESGSLNPDLSTALRNGDVRALRELLDRGAPVNARDAAGNTPLILAAAYADASSLRLLLDRGADVNVANAAGATALMRAAYDYEKVRLLVAHGADVKARSGLGNTALLLAARPANSFRTVKLLLDHGADAKMTNLFGATALMAACAGGDTRTVRLLIEQGVDVNAQPTPDEPGFIFGGGRSALMWAAFRGNTSIIKLLVDAGADVNGVGGLGSPLAQAAWSDQSAAAKLLIGRGAKVELTGPRDGYTALHWAASSEGRDPRLVKLLLDHHADPNAQGGEPVDAFAGRPQTPLMLARRRGETPIAEALTKAGATNASPEDVALGISSRRTLPKFLDGAAIRAAMAQAIPPLQETAIKSKSSFVNHSSKQDCVSCHQQFLPMGAIGLAKRQHIPVDTQAEEQLIHMVRGGELKNNEVDWQALFHPDAVQTKGYALFGWDAEGLPANENVDSWVHHLSAIQGNDGRWYNNLPRPPIQSGDIGATALAVHALQRYPLPGRKAQLSAQVNRARQWLWKVEPQSMDDRIYQLLGLAWAGEPARKLQPLARALIAEQRRDGGWSQLPGLASDAYATAQAVYALRVGAKLESTHEALDRGVRFLLASQLDDGTWHVRRRTFPFQPTMNSGFPHGRDSWISAAASSWAVMALSVCDKPDAVALKR
jgi:ankyrin repeat protein